MNEHYFQPEFYRFNEDSFKLIKWLKNIAPRPEQILDLGAGSGIIGIELAKILGPKELVLVELQDEFLPCLKSNCQTFLPVSVAHSIIIKSFLDFETTQTFDLIVCNPPYYLPGKGELPKNPQRAMARSFLIDSWPVLLMKISKLLSIHGKAYIVLKNDEKLFQMILQQASQLKLELEKNQDDLNMILVLFRLNKN